MFLIYHLVSIKICGQIMAQHLPIKPCLFSHYSSRVQPSKANFAPGFFSGRDGDIRNQKRFFFLKKIQECKLFVPLWWCLTLILNQIQSKPTLWQSFKRESVALSDSSDGSLNDLWIIYIKSSTMCYLTLAMGGAEFGLCCSRPPGGRYIHFQSFSHRPF